MGTKDDDAGSHAASGQSGRGEDTAAPEHRGHPPRSQLNSAERGNPNGVWRRASRPTVRTAESSSGTGRSEKRTPSRRKAPGTHNRMDRADARPERVPTWT